MFVFILSMYIKGYNFKVKVCNYSFVREVFLSNNYIFESVYDILVDVVNKYLFLLYWYMELWKCLLEVEKLYMYDFYILVLGEVLIIFMYEEVKEKVLEVLKLMGEEYMIIVEKVFFECWIDVVENKGKWSGVYFLGSYDINLYILLNWYDILD